MQNPGGGIYTSPILSASPSVQQVQTMSSALGAIESIATANGLIWWNDGIKVGSMAKDGTQGAAYTVPNNGGSDYNMIAGPDGNLWFTQDTSYSCPGCPDYVTRVALSGTPGAMTAYPLPVPSSYTASVHSGPTSIAAGPDGNLWITESIATDHAVRRRNAIRLAQPAIVRRYVGRVRRHRPRGS